MKQKNASAAPQQYTTEAHYNQMDGSMGKWNVIAVKRL